MNNIHYFNTLKEAKEFLRLLHSVKTYHLSHNEYTLPSYKIVKVVNEQRWKIRVTQYFYGPKELKTWITPECYFNMIDYAKAMNLYEDVLF